MARHPATNSTPRSAPALRPSTISVGDATSGTATGTSAPPSQPVAASAAGGRRARRISAGDGADDADGQAQGGRADVEGVEDRSRQRRHDDDDGGADRPADGGRRRPLGATVAAAGTPSATNSGLQRGDEGDAPQPHEGASWPRPSGASTMATVRSRAEMACCWSSMRVTSSMNQAPSVSGSAGPVRPADPAPRRRGRRCTRRGRRAAGASRPAGRRPRRRATARSAPRRRRRSRRRAGTVVPRTSDPHGPACWLTQRTWLPNSPAWRRA